jgi:hypothetical protein
LPIIYYSGKYLATICPLCRADHWTLRKLSLIPHEYRSDVPLICQLCGRDIAQMKPRLMDEVREET